MDTIEKNALVVKALQESERNIRNLVLGAPIAMCVLRGPRFIVEIVNPRLLQIWGKQSEDVQDKPLFEAVPELTNQGDEELRKVYETGEPYRSSERPVVFPFNGHVKTLYIDFLFEAMREADGGITRIIAIGNDVTEQVKARKKIEESEKRFRQMADMMPQMAWTARPDGYVEYFNKQWYEYTGFEECYGDGWIPILHPDDVEGCLATWHNSLQTGEPYEIEYRFADRKNPGNYRWFLGRALPVRDSANTIVKWIGTCTDIDDQKNFTQKLESIVAERTAELKRQNVELESFTYVASHDLQEPLRKIQTFIGLLRKNKEDEESVQKYLGKIELSAQRMSQLIQSVLTYSKLSNSKEQFVDTDLNEILQHVLTDFELLIEEKQAQIKSDKLPVIKGIPLQLHQLFSNLVSNSLKFSQTQPVITITSKLVSGEEIKSLAGIDAAKKYAEIRFADNGIGFDSQFSDQIFKLFQRLHGKSEYSGTGVGLSIAKKIVEKHNGFIIAESLPGQGATFFIWLPMEN